MKTYIFNPIDENGTDQEKAQGLCDSLNQLDIEFGADNVLASNRALLAMQAFITTYPGQYSLDSLNWIDIFFSKRYGDKTKLGHFGTSVIVLRGIPYKFKCHMVYGLGGLVNPIDLPKWFEDLTLPMIASFTNQEIQEVSNFFKIQQGTLLNMNSEIRRVVRPLIDTAVTYIVDESVQDFGKAKFNAMQACEEAYLKYYRSVHAKTGVSIKHPKRHNLGQYNNLAMNHGLPSDAMAWVSTINITPSARYYGQFRNVSLIEAVLAVQNTVLLCSFVGQHI